MPVMDEFQSERNKVLKEGTLKEKLKYFWYYYKWHTIIGALVLYGVISLIVTIVTRKDPAFYAAVINGTSLTTAESFTDKLDDYWALTGTKEEAVVEADLYLDWNNMGDITTTTSQKIAVYASAGDIDVLHGDSSAFDYYAYNDFFMDLREVLSPEQLALYEPYLYYIDKDFLEKKLIADQNRDYSYDDIYPKDPYDSSSMANPIPVGINLTNSTSFTDYYFYRDQVILGVVKSTNRPEKCAQYLDFITANCPPAAN